MEGQVVTDSLTMENTTDNMTLHSQSERSFGVISYGLGTLITVLNTASLICLIRYRKHVRGAGFSQQLIFLCLTDILSGIAISLFYFGSLFSEIDLLIYYSFCIAGIVIYPISNTLSIGNCCIISAQRYIAMRKITRQTIPWNKQRTINMILLNILLCILTFLSSVAVISIRYGFQYEELCNQIDQIGQTQYKFLFVIGPTVICFIFLLCINVCTVLSIFQLAKARREHSSASGSLESDSTISAQFLQFQDFQYATRTFILIVIVLNITLLPPSIMLPIFTNYDIEISATYFEILFRFPSFNSLLNPFVYFFRMRSFRRVIWYDIKKLFHLD